MYGRRSVPTALGYISIDEMVAATEQPVVAAVQACFDGNYPIVRPARTAMGKAVLSRCAAPGRRSHRGQ